MLNATTSASKYTALHYAAYHGHAEVVDTLLEHGAQVSLRNKAGETAIESAAQKGFDSICEKISSFLTPQVNLEDVAQIHTQLTPESRAVLSAAEGSNKTMQGDNEQTENVKRNLPSNLVFEVPKQDSGVTVDSDSSFRTPIPTPIHSRSRSFGGGELRSRHNSDNDEDDDDTAPTPRMRLGHRTPSNDPNSPRTSASLSQKRSSSLPRCGTCH